jgi:hypothetical protein
VAIIDDIANLAPVANPQSGQPSWVKDLIDKRYQPKTERLKRSPIGFDFKREPFDPSSYYKQLGTFRDISRAATNVVDQEVANSEEAARQREQEQNQQAINDALGNINPNFTGGGNYNYNGKSRKYGLTHVSSNTAKAADYFGSKYGISNIGGWRAHGSVPGSDHPKGLAIDLMTNDRRKGTALANDAIKNYKAWNIKYVIYYHYIWSPSRGWHKYNGPSPHTDHVHISFNK